MLILRKGYYAHQALCNSISASLRLLLSSLPKRILSAVFAYRDRGVWWYRSNAARAFLTLFFAFVMLTIFPFIYSQPNCIDKFDLGAGLS